jgi:ferric-dicitrate binding protein FerR (iron transport regulator)
VAVERGGQRPLGFPGQPLFSSDVVSTDQGSSALIRSLDGQEVEVSENTRVRLTATATQLTVELLEGRVITRGGDGGARKLEVRAAGTDTELQMGDVIDVTAARGGGGSRITVTEGDIVLVTPDGGTVSVAKGESADLQMGEIRLAERKPPPAPAAQPISMQLSAERGKTLLRPRGQKKFAPAGEGEVAMADGTAFQVGKGGRALLAGKSGMKARLVAAGGLLESAVLEGTEERYSFGLESGEVQLQFPGGAQRRVQVKGAGKSLEVSTQEPTTATVVASRKGPRLLVTAGSVKLGAGENAPTVQPGQMVDLAQGEPKVVSLPRPSLVLPTRKVRVYADALPSVGLSLPDGARSVQVASDAAFSQVVAEGRVEGDYLPFDPPPQGDVHWRALGQDGAVMAKGHARFDQDPNESADDVEHPHAEVTETGLKAVVYFQSVLPEITFVYTARDGAAQYRLRVYKADDLKTPLWQKEEKETRSTVPAGKLGEGTYLWYAAALSPEGAELSGGRMNKLDMIYDNSRRSLAIARPKKGEKVGKTVDASGVAPIGSKLSLNGKPASLDGKGRFKVAVPATPFLVFRLVTDDGGESFWVRQVRSRER